MTIAVSKSTLQQIEAVVKNISPEVAAIEALFALEGKPQIANDIKLLMSLASTLLPAA